MYDMKKKKIKITQKIVFLIYLFFLHSSQETNE